MIEIPINVVEIASSTTIQLAQFSGLITFIIGLFLALFAVRVLIGFFRN
jgi:hypothetical protein